METPGHDSAVLVADAKNGSRAALAALLDLHPPIRLARGLMRHPRQAACVADVAQELSVSLLRIVSMYDPALGAFQAYVNRAYKNHVANHVQRCPRCSGRMVGAEMDSKAYDSESDGSAGDATQNETDHLLVARLRIALRDLAELDRQILFRDVILGETAREVAEHVGLSADAVRGRLKRARQLLRATLERRARPRRVLSAV